MTNQPTDLTPAQWLLLRGLIARVLLDEGARAARMAARPAGSHAPEKIAAAHALVIDLEAIGRWAGV